MHARESRFVRPLQLALSLLMLLWGSGTRPPVASAQDRTSLYLVSHRWHAGLVIRRLDVTTAHWPEQDDFPDATFLEVGWGDRAYYQDPDPGPGKLLKAALWPTPSVLHVVGFRRPVPAYFAGREILRLEVTEAGVTALAAFIRAAYARDGQGRSIPLGPGLYGESRFYAGRERYHLYRNCNTWAAQALQAAGLPLRPAEVVTVRDLLRQVRPLGEVVDQEAR